MCGRSNKQTIFPKIKCWHDKDKTCIRYKRDSIIILLIYLNGKRLQPLQGMQWSKYATKDAIPVALTSSGTLNMASGSRNLTVRLGPKKSDSEEPNVKYTIWKIWINTLRPRLKPEHKKVTKWLVLHFVCLRSYIPVTSYGHVKTVSSPNHTFYLGKLD